VNADEDVLARGATVGRYLVLEHLGSGATGVVYGAFDPELDRKIAIKLLRPQDADEARRQSRLIREAKAIAKLSHPNVVGIFDVGVHDGQVFLAMEYLAGGTLSQWLAAHKRPWREIVRVFVEVGRGLAAAHAEDLIHRDFKPDNVLLDKQGTPKVVDFGLVRLASIADPGPPPDGPTPDLDAALPMADTALASLTRTGALAGTPAYMSPEQFLGRPVDARTDQFSFCVALHEAIFGERPFAGENVYQLADAVTSGNLRAIPTSAEVPGWLRRALLRGLRPSSSDRYADLDALLRVIGDDPVVKRKRRMAVGGAAVLVALALLAMERRSHHARADLEQRVAQDRAKQDQALADARSVRHPGAVKQVLELVKAKRFADAALIAKMDAIPRATWFTQGSPKDVEREVRSAMAEPASEGRVPVLVAYNVPFRDCGQYDAGDAPDTAAYMAWIDGFARGIGDGKAIVILEPGSLGIIPNNTIISGKPDWCHPTVRDGKGNNVPAPGASPADRYAQLHHAVRSLRTHAPNASVYLDGTHSGWLPVGEIAYRLVRAGVHGAHGFFVNAAHYRATDEVVQFGTWVSGCIAIATAGRWSRRDYEQCPSQYHPGANLSGRTGPNCLPSQWCNMDFEPYGIADYGEAHVASVTSRLKRLMGGAEASTHFVVDTSRNGQGHWRADPGATFPNCQDWCNPPGRGLGLRPTVRTGRALVDAYLWIKSPGKSDGPCNRGVAGSRGDPLWGGMVDPPPGDWFAPQALQLAQLAYPPL
jgi:endoglucanase